VAAGNFYLHDLPEALRFEIRGPLDSSLIEQILASWSTARSILRGRPVELDLRQAELPVGALQHIFAPLAQERIRWLVREDQLEPARHVLQRSPKPAAGQHAPAVRKWWCGFLRYFRPRCCWSLCAPARLWIL